MSDDHNGLGCYHRNYTITLAVGREINLMTLSQRLTYASLLEGLPSYNPKQVERDRLHAAQHAGCPAVTVDARPIPLPIPQGQSELYARRHKGELTSLPPVTCVARFESLAPVRGESADGSQLVMVWYQESFGLPGDPVLLDKIRQVDWEGLASNFDI